MKIEATEKALLELSARLDQPLSPRDDPQEVALVIGHRVRALYRGYLLCADNGMHNASRTLLRPMVEANILLRFIREHPEWRTKLWHAQTRKRIIDLVELIHRHPLPREQQLEHLPTFEDLIPLRREVASVRKGAQDAGVKGVSKNGPLIPPVRKQAELLDTLEVWQAYVIAYTPLGYDQHVGHGSFRDAVRYTLDDGRVLLIDAETPRPEERLLASSVFASTLVIVSSWLDLGIEDAANRLRRELVGR